MAERNMNRLHGVAAAAAIAALISYLVLASASDRITHRALSWHVRTIGEVTYKIDGKKTGRTTLPHTFEGLPPRTPVEIVANLDVMPDDSLLIKTFYSPLRVYVDDKLFFKTGQDGQHPAFMNYPPTIVELLRLPRGARELRLEYLSPTQRDRLEVQAIFAGNDLVLYSKLLGDNTILLFFSLFLLFFGVMTIMLTFFLLRGLPKARALPWLGLFSISAGIWGMAECDYTLFLLPYPTLLYVLSFAGLFFIPIPYMVYGMMIMNPMYKRQLKGVLYFDTACFIGALALQASGTADLSRSMVLFHFIGPVSFFVFSGLMWQEYRVTGRPEARRFCYPLLILAVFAALEVLNYRVRFTNMLSIFFLVGVVLFIFDLGLIGGSFVRKSSETERDKDRLEAEMRFVSRALDARRDEYARMAESAAMIAAARHDLRHQLAVIRRYNADGNPGGLEKFLDEIASTAQTRQEPVCHNYAAAAIAGHYLSLARESGIEVDAKLDIPIVIGRVNDMDFCVIIGNLLENAVEACRRTGGKRFITARARIYNEMLSIIVENSFDGTYIERGGEYFSLKRGMAGEITPGIGISSVREVCRKYDGMVRFDIMDNVWRTSAIIDIREKPVVG